MGLPSKKMYNAVLVIVLALLYTTGIPPTTQKSFVVNYRCDFLNLYVYDV